MVLSCKNYTIEGQKLHDITGKIYSILIRGYSGVSGSEIPVSLLKSRFSGL